MNRLAGIIVAAVGLIITVLGILKVVSGVTQLGIVLILFGGLIFGLSFIRKPETGETAKMPVGETLTKIFYAPGEVFRNLRNHPRWFAAILIMAILSAIYANAFAYRLTPERITNFTLDKTLEMPMMNDQARQQVEAGRAKAIADSKNPVLRVAGAVTNFAGLVFLYAFLAAVFFLFALSMGGKMNYWQAFAAAVYAAFPVTIIRHVLNTLILFIKDPTDIHPITGQTSLIQDNLGIFVTASEHPVLFILLSSFSLLSLYWIIMNALGLKKTGEEVTPIIAWTATLTIWFVGLLLGVITAWMFPGFIS